VTHSRSTDAFYVVETISSSHILDGAAYTHTQRAAWLTSDALDNVRFHSARKLNEWIEQITSSRNQGLKEG
jgi:hypothetical protein